jgi:hypothetical protein
MYIVPMRIICILMREYAGAVFCVGKKGLKGVEERLKSRDNEITTIAMLI